MTGLSVRDISKVYRLELPREDAFSTLRRFFSGRSPSEPFKALQEISFALEPGRALALCGPNGSGKTTLLKILAGITVPSSGGAAFAGKTACLLGFGAILQDRLSVRENARLCSVFFELPGAPDANAERILEAAGLLGMRNARAGELSTGMRLRLPFMAALDSGADLLLIDEALAVGDEDFRTLSLARLTELKRRGAIIIFSTHDHALARSFADDALVLNSGRAVYFGRAADMPGHAAAPAPQREPGAGFARALSHYELLYARLAGAGFQLEDSPPASDEDLLLAHTPAWVTRLKANDLSAAEETRLALPHSGSVLPLSWRMAGGAIAAARRALADGLGIFPAGGGHHAFPDRGEGFCPVNDIAVAAKVLLRDGLAKRPAVIDLDAHQGNGTAFIFSGGEVKTFSAHRADGYPALRVRSTMDVEIPSGSGDAAYLEAVRTGIKDFMELAKPDFVFALCAADPFEKDPLGGLQVSLEGLKQRDEFLFGILAAAGVPVCLLLGGGYGKPDETAEINFRTISAAAAAWGRQRPVINR